MYFLVFFVFRSSFLFLDRLGCYTKDFGLISCGIYVCVVRGCVVSVWEICWSGCVLFGGVWAWKDGNDVGSLSALMLRSDDCLFDSTLGGGISLSMGQLGNPVGG